ncbi:hypothetical protein RSOLAG1IB_06696 [Rhizoctonia solani AG-1 IB]|uniref:FAS1 domain-containing protein n=1 Tax=Thanatephorus cucumeris (strain AG1-IB / isolate 7/3/14) TaxID=1108050 RepID=A0A0B7FAG5_THACB|nr:hypothetical protein RSOLAG1IB_06696 [Rhizoctonia solani AG-1 IB]
MRWRTLAQVLLAGSVLADQQPFEAVGEDTSVGDFTFRKTIIDVLSADDDYTLLLKALQRARLVPTLNRINGSTLFAPTNAAIERYVKSHPDSLWASLVSDSPPTNPHNELRQHVFYHILNYTATPTTSNDLPAAPATFTHRTLHFPQAPNNGSGPPSREPPDLPPWMPVPGGLLAGEPQRVRITWRDDAAWVSVSEQGERGVKVVKADVEAANGRVVGIDSVLSLPKNLSHVVKHHPNLKTLSRYITPAIEQVLSDSPHLTLFVPDDKAWDALKPMEKLWLDSGFAERDLMDIFARHATTGEKPHQDRDFADDIKVGWSEHWGSDSSYQSLTDSTLQLVTHSNGTTMVNNGIASVLQKDVYASNGVLHTLDSLLVPSGAPLFKATAEKWLLALNATVFVGMLREAGLDSYVNGAAKDKEWTILAPADDVLNDILRKRDLNVFGSIKNELRTLLRYHIIPGILKPEDLADGQLLGTELRPDSLKGDRMRLKVDVVSGKTGVVGTQREGGMGNGDLAFGGANVIAEPVRVGNTIIYLLSRPLNLPPDAMQAALGSLDHTTFTSLLFSAGLNVSRPATTLLVPVNGAFASRGLATKWLMMDDIDARTGLKRVLMHHLLEGIIIGKDLWFDGGSGSIVALGDGSEGGGKKKKSWGTVEGSDVRVIKEGDSLLIEASGPDESPLPLTVLDTLTQTGALHEVSGVLWPRSVRVGIRELGLAADASTMLRLVQRAGFEGIWNGTGLPVDNVVNVYPPLTASAKWGKWRLGGSGSGDSKKPRAPKWTYTLLCPTDAAFARINLTRLLDDHDALVALVRQHIVPIPLAEEGGGVGAKDSTSIGWVEWIMSHFVTPEHGIENLLNGEYAQFPSRARPHSNIVSATAGAPFEPDAETPLPLQSSTARFGTLQTSHSTYGDVVFAHTGDHGWAITVKGADEWVGVKAWGKTIGATPGVVSGLASNSPLTGGVVQIDRVLEPYSPSWWREWVPALGVGAAGVVAIGLVFWGIVWVWKRDVQEATYEPANGDEDE